eukprot:GHVS01035323.1.p2 GENE.GHVS01035323.1~~GHVS01035323.1.p2  ORF type:complete len:143 (+),score=20.04 GHVS01035323.1:558-986(+)
MSFTSTMLREAKQHEVYYPDSTLPPDLMPPPDLTSADLTTSADSSVPPTAVAFYLDSAILIGTIVAAILLGAELFCSIAIVTYFCWLSWQRSKQNKKHERKAKDGSGTKRRQSTENGGKGRGGSGKGKKGQSSGNKSSSKGK